MGGANYTGGRRNAAKARSKDTTTRLQRGHFSKQRLGILTDALRSRRTDHHQSLSHSRLSPDDPNLTSNSPSGSLISPSVYSTCTPAATVYDISLEHAKRDFAQKQRQRQSAQLHWTDGLPSSPCLDPSARNDLPAVTSPVLTGNGKPDTTAPSSQTLLSATTPAAIPSCTSSSSSPSRPLSRQSSYPEPEPHPASLSEKQPTPVTDVRRSKVLDLIDISDRERFCFLRTPRFVALPVSMYIPSHKSWRTFLFIIYHTAPYRPTHRLERSSLHSQSIRIHDHRSRDNTCSTRTIHPCGNPLFPRGNPRLVSPSCRSSCSP